MTLLDALHMCKAMSASVLGLLQAQGKGRQAGQDPGGPLTLAQGLLWVWGDGRAHGGRGVAV